MPGDETQRALEGTELPLEGSEGQQEPLPGEPEEKTFFNPADVPEELRPTFREMKKGHTQALQEVAVTRKQLETERQGLGAAAYKAQLFDALTGDPRVQGFLKNLQDQGEGPVLSDESETDSTLDPQVEKLLAQRLVPVEKELRTLREQTALAAERQNFLAAHPDFVFDEWKDDLERAWTMVPNLTMEAAFRIARDERTQRDMATMRKKTEAARTTVERGGVPGATAGRPREIKSFRDAVDASLSELNLSRRDFRGFE